MTDPIRYRIIDAVIAKASEIRINRGYASDMGKNISVLSRHNKEPEFVAVWPGTEEISGEYGNEVARMNLKIEGVREIGARDKLKLSEEILADIIECMVGVRWILDFTSGGTHVPTPGDAVLGAAASAILESVSLESGTWGAGDAAGEMILRRKSGTFGSENLDIGGESDVATTDGSIVTRNPEITTANQLADDIRYVSGGLEEYPEGWEEVVGMSANFIITYPIIMGNPYSQP